LSCDEKKEIPCSSFLKVAVQVDNEKFVDKKILLSAWTTSIWEGNL
jgi:hypothetical protein